MQINKMVRVACIVTEKFGGVLSKRISLCGGATFLFYIFIFDIDCVCFGFYGNINGITGYLLHVNGIAWCFGVNCRNTK